MSDDYERQNRELSEAVSRILAPDMVTGFVLIASVIQQDGKRGLHMLVDEDAKAWDTLGRLDYAKAIEHAAINADYADDEDE